MFETTKVLLERIRLGEDTFLELKEVRFKEGKVAAPGRSALADELAAMANDKGGVCLLGVDDSKDIIGIPVERLDAVEALVSEVCNDSCKPPLSPTIERLNLPTVTGETVAILKVTVERSLFVHKSPGGYFHRVGSSKREMPQELLARLFQQRSQVRMIRFDEQIVPGASAEDLHDDVLPRFVSERATDERIVVMRKLGLIREDDHGTWRPTVAGVLFGTEDPTRWMPNAYVQAVTYKGSSVVPDSGSELYQLDAKDITGPLHAQVGEACKFVYRNMTMAARKSAGREDVPQYDMGAILEALVNAIVHRDYSIHGSKIRLRLFADRLELYSPGGLPNSLDIESISERQSTRNEALASMMARCTVPDFEWLDTARKTMMDRRGEGVPIILSASEALSGKRPEYELIRDSEVKLTIYGPTSEETGEAE